MRRVSLYRRRQLLATLAATAAAPAAAPALLALASGGARAHGELGPVLPRRAAPAVALTLHDGRRETLPQRLLGQVTALQLMFTGCSATCPVQGAVFAALQDQVLGRVPGAQLLSLSIDALGDDAAALAAWRLRFRARPGWVAAVPPPAQADVMPGFLDGRATGADRHRAQTWLFDRQGRLAFRLAELAPAEDIARAMAALAAQEPARRR